MQELFESKVNRDIRAKELKAQGKQVKRRSTGQQFIDPKYVKDSGITSDEIRRDYRTEYANLYAVEYA